jgi:hypothetical protein
MTNREAHEEAAGYGLDGLFFMINGIDPDAEYHPEPPKRWLNIDMTVPDEGQEVWYYFGFFDHIYSGKHRSFREEGYAPGVMSHCFFGASGFLTDDVTWWMPRVEDDLRPDRPSRYQRKRDYHSQEALAGGCGRA